MYCAEMATRLTQTERRELTRRRLLDAARTEFGARGFGAATLDEIASAAGVTRGALYYNFPRGKHDLFLALLEERSAERADAVGARFAGPTGPQATISQAAAAAGDAGAAMAENREWWLLFFEFALRAARERDFARDFAEREGRMRRSLEELVSERAAALGAELPIPARDVAVGLNALGNGLALDALVDDELDPGELFGALVGFLVRGMVAAAGDRKGDKGGKR